MKTRFDRWLKRKYKNLEEMGQGKGRDKGQLSPAALPQSGQPMTQRHMQPSSLEVLSPAQQAPSGQWQASSGEQLTSSQAQPASAPSPYPRQQYVTLFYPVRAQPTHPQSPDLLSGKPMLIPFQPYVQQTPSTGPGLIHEQSYAQQTPQPVPVQSREVPTPRPSPFPVQADPTSQPVPIHPQERNALAAPNTNKQNCSIGEVGNLTRNGLGISCKDWDCQNATHGQNVMNRAQSLSGVNKNFTADIEECDEDQPHCERNKFLVCGLSECTTKEGLENFIQAKSGEEVKEVQIMKQHSALVTMANDIRNFIEFKRKIEERRLNDAQIFIVQVPFSRSIDVTDISDNTTYDAIELCFESRRHCGGPVEKIHFMPGGGGAVVMFKDLNDVARVLARHQEQPIVLNGKQLSIKIHHELHDDEKRDGEVDITQTTQLPRAKIQMDVNPYVMEHDTIASTANEAQLEEACHKKTRKKYWNQTSPGVPKEMIILLKKIKFAEKLKDKNKELEVKMNIEKEEIYFEGPQEQLCEATDTFRKHMKDKVVKKLNLSTSVLKVLWSEEGIKKVNHELERNSNSVEAICFNDKDAIKIVGTSSEHADAAEKLMNDFLLEKRVEVDEKSDYLLKSPEWIKICKEINAMSTVHVHEDAWNDTYVAGFKDEVSEVLERLSTFLEDNYMRQEDYVCISAVVRRYLGEFRQKDLRSIEARLKEFNVSIKNGQRRDHFEISGKREGLKRVREELDHLTNDIASHSFDLKQPGLLKYLSNEEGKHLIKLVEMKQDCAIDFKKNENAGKESEIKNPAASGEKEMTIEGGDDDDDDDDVEENRGICLLESFPPKTKHEPAMKKSEAVDIEVVQGDICKEKTNAIVIMLGKDLNMDNAGILSKAVKKLCGQVVQEELNKLKRQPATSAVITCGGNLPTRHIIHLIPDSSDKDHLQQCVEKCLQLAETQGLSSISIPAIGTGKHRVSAVDSANLIFKAIQSFNGICNRVRKVRIVIFQVKMLPAFQQEQFKHSHHLEEDASRRTILNSPFSVEVTTGDLTKENTSDAIMNIASTGMNLNNAGELSKAIAKACGQLLLKECHQPVKISPGSAVMTSGGNLTVPHIIHVIPGSPDLQHLQQCLEEGLRLADNKSLKSISIPCIGTGGYKLAAAQSARVIFQALSAFSASCNSIQKVKVVVFKTDLKKEFEFLQTQQRQQLKSEDDESSDSERKAAKRSRKRGRRQEREPVQRYSVKVCVVGKDKPCVENAAECLHERFAHVFLPKTVESPVISDLSQNQIRKLERKAAKHDVKIEVEVEIDRIAVRGESNDVHRMVQEIWGEIKERTEQKIKEEIAQILSNNIVWSYELNGNAIEFGPKENAKIELAHSKGNQLVKVSLGGKQFVIDVQKKFGFGPSLSHKIILVRKVKGADHGGFPLPTHWTLLPPPDMDVNRIDVAPSSKEYKDVERMFQTTAKEFRILKIERIQNRSLYQSYMARKHKMDNDAKGSNERRLFHGTDGQNVNKILSQGFNRSLCGVHGTRYGRGVYFARDAKYSVNYTGSGKARYMFLAKVLVGQYCFGKPLFVEPPAIHPSMPEVLYDSVVDNEINPSIFVVFRDNQCYPEYLITFAQ